MGIRVCVDTETNSLINPKKIWLVCCRDLDTGENYVFKEVCTEAGPTEEAKRFLRFAEKVTYWVGHNWLEFDYPVLHRLIGLVVPDVFSSRVSCDTLIVSRVVNYSRGRLPVEGTSDRPITRGHSIESYGEEFGYPKLGHQDFTKLSPEMEAYCLRDVDICERIYRKYLPVLEDTTQQPAIELEHQFQQVVNQLHDNGFAFNTTKANKLLDGVTKELGELDGKIRASFLPVRKLVRLFTPKATKFGTISKTSVPRSLWSDIAQYEVGKEYPVYEEVVFNPASHKQLIEVLHDAGWRPTDKTQSHIDTERELRVSKLDIDHKKCEDKLIHLAKYGWKINEQNLASLPPDAPPSSRLLARRILLEARRRTLTEWLSLAKEDGRIHGRFYGIGAWTHRMAHQAPNTANIPNELDTQGKKKLLGKEMRSLWCAPARRLLVGVDAEGIQLRIFAHLIDDPEFTDALVKGQKADKTDPHSLNQRIIGSVCKSRAAAKRFIFALLLGAGLWKLSQILECSEAETKAALDRLLERYSGWQRLRADDIPRDAQRGYFTGLDGRKVSIPGRTVSEKKHLAMSGYLQSGEAIVMKKATLRWMKEIEDARSNSTRISTFASQASASESLLGRIRESIAKSEIKIVNLVHDEWQTETQNDMAEALWVAEVQSRSLSSVGAELGLRCPLAGSYYNDDIHDYTIGTNWSVTH